MPTRNTPTQLPHGQSVGRRTALLCSPISDLIAKCLARHAVDPASHLHNRLRARCPRIFPRVDEPLATADGAPLAPQQHSGSMHSRHDITDCGGTSPAWTASTHGLTTFSAGGLRSEFSGTSLTPAKPSRPEYRPETQSQCYVGASYSVGHPLARRMLVAVAQGALVASAPTSQT